MEKEDIKISIIIPIYQVERYLETCLQSVCRQSYRNLEIILVDDCSKDGCGAICDRYAAEDPRIKVIHHDRNKGLSAARNTGMTQATGEYYMFVDSDDWIDEKLCENAVNILKNNIAEVDTVHWGYCCVNEEGKEESEEHPILYPQGKIVPPEIFDKFMSTLTVSLDDLYHWFSGGQSYYEAVHSKKQMATVWRYLLSAKVIRENSLQFHLHAGRGEDIVFMLCYLQRCKGIVNLPGKAYYYLQRPDSLIRDAGTISKKIELIEAMEETVSFAPKEKQEELRNKWRGQRILVVMNTARKLVKSGGFIKGYKEFHKVAAHPINQDAVKQFRLKGIPKKYMAAIGMIKYHMYFLFYLCIYGMNRLHVDMAPMD